ncbi:MAG: hypothetical protein HQK49_04865 [Oligoflexia bacterium]|nr:hypothetical protein [Oligoflexia bacterium]
MLTNYLYFLVNDQYKKLLKDEIKLKYPHFKICYSKNGLLTYKVDDIDVDIIFAHAYGNSIGMSNKSELTAKISSVRKKFSNKNVILNFHNCNDQDLQEQQDPQESALVLDVIKIDDDHFFLGIHPFGKYRTILNYHQSESKSESNPLPSRAYYKIKEALALSGEKINKKECVLDIGAAPGGISYFFLQHKLNVVAVDAAEMSPLCTSHKNFTHIALPLEKITDNHLSKYSFNWIVIDINLDPLYVVSTLKKLFNNEHCTNKPTNKLRGLFFTVKLTKNFTHSKIPTLLKNLTKLKLKLKIIYTRQLPSNKSEFMLYAIPI